MAVRAAGGVLTAEDLASYATVDRTPIETRYRGLRVASMPPSSSGGLALIEALGIMAARYPSGPAAAGETRGSAAQLHVLAQAFKHAFADRARYLGDTDFVTVDVAHLASPGYHAELARRINRARCCRATRTGRWGPARAAQGRGDVAPVRDRRRGQRGRADDDHQPRLRCSPGRGQDRHALNDEMDDFCWSAGSRTHRPDRQRAERACPARSHRCCL